MKWEGRICRGRGSSSSGFAIHAFSISLATSFVPFTQTTCQPPVLEFLYRRIWPWTNFQIDAKLKLCSSLDSFMLERFTLLTEEHPILYSDIQGLPKPIFSWSFPNSFIPSTCSWAPVLSTGDRQWAWLGFISYHLSKALRDSCSRLLLSGPYHLPFSLLFFQTLS